jgi:hypothetical protein
MQLYDKQWVTLTKAIDMIDRDRDRLAKGRCGGGGIDISTQPSPQNSSNLMETSLESPRSVRGGKS